MSHSVELLLLSCLLLTFHSSPGQILPPQNLSLVWKSDFYPQFDWQPPQQSQTGCSYSGTISTKKEIESFQMKATNFKQYTTMEGGHLNFSVKFVCGGDESEPATFRVTYPDLVTNLKCYSFTEKNACCYWSPASNVGDLRFYSRLVNEVGPDSSTELQECQSYGSSGGVKTHCELNATTLQSIHIVFNATLNNTVFRNTFRRETICSVKSPPLKWTVTKNRDGLNVSWTPPKMLKLLFWTFNLTYNKCDKAESLMLKNVTSYQINWVPRCRYCISIEALNNNECPDDSGSRPTSELTRQPECFDADVDINPLVFMAVFMPLVFAFLAALTFCCCWRNKDNLFPKVPKPRDLITDISDNNNESSFCKLYIPAKEEEEDCKITLIVDIQTNKPDC